MQKYEIIKFAEKWQKLEKDVPQTCEEEGFVKDEGTYLDDFAYKNIGVNLDRCSGQNNVWYNWIIHYQEGNEEMIDTGNFVNDVKKIMKEIDRRKNDR